MKKQKVRALCDSLAVVTAAAVWMAGSICAAACDAARANSLPIGAQVRHIQPIVQTSANSPLPAGAKAPNFVTRTIDGKMLTLHSLRGRVVLLDFWATWCGPCRMSTPTLVALDREFHHRDFTVVGMSLDDTDSRADIGPFQHQYHVAYTLTYSPQANVRAAMAYHINFDPDNGQAVDTPVPPSVFLIDRKGRIRWSQIGYTLDERATLTPLIKKLLSE